jgi:hypothetical protein
MAALAPWLAMPEVVLFALAILLGLQDRLSPDPGAQRAWPSDP